MKRKLFVVSSIAALLALASAWGCRRSESVASTSAPRASWSKEVVAAFQRIPVQEGGRVKPLSTYASFLMLRLCGRRSLRTEWGETLSPTEWLLDTFFYPEVAKRYPVFLVTDDQALDAVGVVHEGRKRRDRYSFAELWPARSKIEELGSAYEKIDERKRTRLQGQIVDLRNDLMEFLGVVHWADFARQRFELPDDRGVRILFPEREKVTFSEVLAKLPSLQEVFARLRKEDLSDNEEARKRRDGLVAAVSSLVRAVEFYGNRASAIAMFPPATPVEQEPAYHTPASLMMAAVEGKDVSPYLPVLALLERMAERPDDRAAFASRAAEVRAKLADLAQARGEYSKIGLEVTYYRLDLFFWACIGYVLAFLLLAFSWLFRGGVRWLVGLGWLGVGASTLAVVAAITLRCVIRERPPMTALFDTIPFITGTSVIVALVAEWINKRRLALPVAAFFGAAGMFLTLGYETRGQDTMGVLPAVLDTNFWLATHVVVINIGYAGCLLAGIIAHVFLLGRIFGIGAPKSKTYAEITRMVYGATCFGAVFATVGTILGGIWAAESWGRFWGWDPKENGALMIVLWSLVMLHARMGGYVRAFGFNAMAVVLAVVVAFSWWHVNLLGVGLHSYGFTSGVKQRLIAYYGIEGLVLLAAGIRYWVDLNVQKALAARAAQGGEPTPGEDEVRGQEA